ncbi:uncharacterized protein BO66DRAFT_405666 [Aspergillus aculeatinus CBS 121060]|uniref:Uncharacterized protein n=1 Tax=Aspergillus aculeatinus CBS 121060 TaxID=1448322 RepID=A0ACD1GV66_9EURO|nr:hypothetical protein BO66DRAFT_405666 [Aspergillus aculeatinus CBS 121060]RAH65355.1 hypothetical protein BO66DRAFT_405666 [Aspergillus aculeatinus CBS 121060]
MNLSLIIFMLSALASLALARPIVNDTPGLRHASSGVHHGQGGSNRAFIWVKSSTHGEGLGVMELWIGCSGTCRGLLRDQKDKQADSQAEILWGGRTGYPLCNWTFCVARVRSGRCVRFNSIQFMFHYPKEPRESLSPPIAAQL